MTNQQLMTRVMEKISKDVQARRMIAFAIGSGNADQVRRAAAGVGLDLSGDEASRLTASVSSVDASDYEKNT